MAIGWSPPGLGLRRGLAPAVGDGGDVVVVVCIVVSGTASAAAAAAPNTNEARARFACNPTPPHCQPFNHNQKSETTYGYATEYKKYLE